MNTDLSRLQIKPSSSGAKQLECYTWKIIISWNIRSHSFKVCVWTISWISGVIQADSIYIVLIVLPVEFSNFLGTVYLESNIVLLVSRYPAAGNCFQKTRYPAVRNFDQFSWNSSFNSSKNIRYLFRNLKRYKYCLGLKVEAPVELGHRVKSQCFQHLEKQLCLQYPDTWNKNSIFEAPSVNEVFRMKAEHFSFKTKVLAIWKVAKQSRKTPFCSGE